MDRVLQGAILDIIGDVCHTSNDTGAVAAKRAGRPILQPKIELSPSALARVHGRCGQTKGIEMQDFRLVAARKLAHCKNVWQDQGHLWLVIHTLKQIVADVTETLVARAEAEMLIKKLYLVGRRPAFK